MKVRLFAIMLCSAQLIGCATTGAGSTQHTADMQPGKSRVKASPTRTRITRERLARDATFGVQRVINGYGWVVYQAVYVAGMVFGGGGPRGDFSVAPGAEWVDAFQ